MRKGKKAPGDIFVIIGLSIFCLQIILELNLPSNSHVTLELVVVKQTRAFGGNQTRNPRIDRLSSQPTSLSGHPHRHFIELNIVKILRKVIYIRNKFDSFQILNFKIC